MTDLSLNWKEEGNEYFANTSYGRVIITEIRNRRIISGVKYAARIEKADGEIVRIRHELDDLESAKWLLIERLQAIANEKKNRSELNDLLVTIETCRQHMSNSAQHSNHLDRIEQIIREYYVGSC